MRRFAAAVGMCTVVVAGCAHPPSTSAPGLMDVTHRPAEKALLAGIRAYDDGNYTEAEKHFHAALKAGLGSARDKAAAHKYLAFMYCTSNRTAECEGAFRAARQADPAFALTRSENGHPLWGPVYRRALP